LVATKFVPDKEQRNIRETNEVFRFYRIHSQYSLKHLCPGSFSDTDSDADHYPLGIKVAVMKKSFLCGQLEIDESNSIH